MTDTELFFDHECSRCGGGAHDIVDEAPPKHEGFVTLWCVYCGLREDIPKRQVAPAKREAKATTSTHEPFRFSHGRFKGMTFEEADAQPNGRQYLEWMAKNSEKLGGRITEYLAQCA